MAGHWLKTQKGTRPIFSHLEPTSLVNKGFIIWPKRELYTCGTDAGNPEPGKMVPARVANQNAGFASSCRSRIQEYNNKG